MWLLLIQPTAEHWPAILSGRLAAASSIVEMAACMIIVVKISDGSTCKVMLDLLGLMMVRWFELQVEERC
jgi:hypothetical protein